MCVFCQTAEKKISAGITEPSKRYSKAKHISHDSPYIQYNSCLSSM